MTVATNVAPRRPASAYNAVMKIANVAEFESRLGEYLATTENAPLARVVPGPATQSDGDRLRQGIGGQELGRPSDPAWRLRDAGGEAVVTVLLDTGAIVRACNEPECWLSLKPADA